jgi:DNA replication protein DnaC
MTSTKKNDDLGRQLEEIGLRGVGDEIESILAGAKRRKLDHRELIAELIRIESEDKARRSLERRQTRARIGPFKLMTDFDWDWPQAVDRGAIDRALNLEFVEEGANVVIAGAHGLGKTMILKNIAHRAILAGKTVLVTTAAKMLGELASIDSPTKLERRMKYYVNIKVLCVDELGYLSYDNRAADLLFEIVSRRYLLGRPLVLTTNLAFKEWNQVFPHATCTIALVDRLTHRADIIKITGDSWRKKEAQERAKAR